MPVEAPTGVGKTKVALEFVREVWRHRGGCRVLVVVPRRVLAYKPWKKDIDKWLSDIRSECLILPDFMTPRERTLTLSRPSQGHPVDDRYGLTPLMFEWVQLFLDEIQVLDRAGVDDVTYGLEGEWSLTSFQRRPHVLK